MDGTGDLFAPLLDVLPPDAPRRVIAYPADRPLAYPQLVDHVTDQLGDAPAVLIAESFSGPIALHLATRRPDRVLAVVLCASFVTPPASESLRWLARPTLFKLPAPAIAIRKLLVGDDAPPQLVSAVHNAIRKVAPHVLAARLREILQVDATAALAACPSPILYLRPRADRLVRASAIDAIRSTRPDIAFHELDGPHLLLQTRPREAWRTIDDFLKRLPS